MASAPEKGTAIGAKSTPWEAAKAMVCLEKWLAPAIRKISAKKKRPKTTTAPCQKLIASTSLEIAIEFVAMYFLLLLVGSAYEQPRKLSLPAPSKSGFLSFLHRRTASPQYLLMSILLT